MKHVFVYKYQKGAQGVGAKAVMNVTRFENPLNLISIHIYQSGNAVGMSMNQSCFLLAAGVSQSFELLLADECPLR